MPVALSLAVFACYAGRIKAPRLLLYSYSLFTYASCVLLFFKWFFLIEANKTPKGECGERSLTAKGEGHAIFAIVMSFES